MRVRLDICGVLLGTWLFFGAAFATATTRSDRESPRWRLPSEELPPEFLDQARRLFNAVRIHEVPTIEAQIDTLVQMREAALIQNLTLVAGAFLARFRVEKAALDPSDAIRIASKAVAIAPDFPPLYFQVAQTVLQADPSAIGLAMRAVLDGIAAYRRHASGLVVLLGNAAFHLCVTVGFGVALLSLFLLLRHLRLLAHDIGDLFPAAPSAAFSASELADSRRARFITESGLNRVLSVVVTGLVLVFPLMLGFGLVPTGLFWLLATGAYLKRADVVIAAFALLLSGALWPLAIASNLPAVLESSDGPRIVRCTREVCHPDDAERLQDLLASDPSDPDIAIAAASDLVHRGPSNPSSLERASRILAAARADERTGVLAADVTLLLALASCADGEPDRARVLEARDGFRRVLATSPESVEALRGLAIAEALAANRPAMEAALTRLVAVLPERELAAVARIRVLTARDSPCAEVSDLRMQLRPPLRPEPAVILRGIRLASVPAALPARTALAGRMPVSVLPLFAVAGLLAFFIVARAARRGHLSYACPRCGGVTCRSCNLRASGFDYCPTCLLEQVRPGFVDPRDTLAHQQARERERSAARLFATALALVVPGSAQVLSGRTVRGVFLLLAFAFAASFVWQPAPIHLEVTAPSGPPPRALPALPPILLVVIYFFSAFDVWRHRRQ